MSPTSKSSLSNFLNSSNESVSELKLNLLAIVAGGTVMPCLTCTPNEIIDPEDIFAFILMITLSQIMLSVSSQPS